MSNADAYALNEGIYSPQEKRLGEILSWLDYFKEQTETMGRGTVMYRKNAQQQMNDLYWKLVEERVRPYIEPPDPLNIRTLPLIHHSKIIAVMEFVVMSYLPVLHVNKNERIKLNAILALFIAKQIIFSWNRKHIRKQCPDLFPFEQEHLTWLRLKKISQFPIFSNASTWFLYDALYLHYNSNFIYRLLSPVRIQLPNNPRHTETSDA